MKIVFLTPDSYSLKNILMAPLEKFGHEVIYINFLDFFLSVETRIYHKLNSMPMRFKKYYYQKYWNKINSRYLEIVYNVNPDLVLVYNDQFLDLQTAREIKKIAKLFFYLGDNPYFLVDRFQDMAPVFYEADYVFCPDSYWMNYLKKTGMRQIELLFVGYDRSLNYIKEPTQSDIENYASDLVMIGRTYQGAWGYKRAKFYNLFADMNIKIYGHKDWTMWYPYFPKLKEKVLLLKEYLSFETVNTILNCCKIYPIESNPGIIDGIHIRLFDALGSGILPLPEYHKDYDLVFNQVKMPTIDNYANADKIAKYYLNHESERARIILELREFIHENYTPEIALQKILNRM